MHYLPVLLIALLLSLPSSALATHKSAVAGVVIDSSDPGITAAHGDVCGYTHFHGELSGVADPAPNGCGHGEVQAIEHGEGDGETLPAPPAPGLWDSFVSFVKSIFTKENAMNVVDVAAEANGIPPPGTVSNTVDIVQEATPSIMENADNVREYRESVGGEEDTLGVYNNPAAGLEEGSLSQKFFKWFNSLVP